jgi:hypothetical protein
MMATLLLASLGGCYEHVVRTKGIGTRRVDVYEPNLRDEPERIPVADDVEDAKFGPRKPERDRATRR